MINGVGNTVSVLLLLLSVLSVNQERIRGNSELPTGGRTVRESAENVCQGWLAWNDCPAVDVPRRRGLAGTLGKSALTPQSLSPQFSVFSPLVLQSSVL